MPRTSPAGQAAAGGGMIDIGVGPAGTAHDAGGHAATVVDRLQRGHSRACRPRGQAKAAGPGTEANGGTAAEFGKFIDDETRKWARYPRRGPQGAIGAQTNPRSSRRRSSPAPGSRFAVPQPSHCGSCPASKSSSKRKCLTLLPRRRTSFKASIPISMCLSM